jgi:hypothetical protein
LQYNGVSLSYNSISLTGCISASIVAVGDITSTLFNITSGVVSGTDVVSYTSTSIDSQYKVYTIVFNQNNYSGSYAITGNIRYYSIYNTALDITKETKRLLTLKTPNPPVRYKMFDVNGVTMGKDALILSAEYEAVGTIPKEWNKGTGTYQIVESDITNTQLPVGTKSCKCISSGTQWTHSNKAYGTWFIEGWLYQGLDSIIAIITNDNMLSTGLRAMGYTVRMFAGITHLVLQRSSESSGTNRITAINALTLGVYYDVIVTRDLDNTFNLYYKEHSSINWIKVGNGVIDSTYTTSSTIQIYFPTNISFMNIKHFDELLIPS